MESGDNLSAAHLAKAWSTLEPESADAWNLLADALLQVAESTFNVPARNYTFSTANRARATAERLTQ